MRSRTTYLDCRTPVVPDVECLAAKLETQPFADWSFLDQRDIPVVQSRPKHIRQRAGEVAELVGGRADELRNVEVTVQAVLDRTFQSGGIARAVRPLAASLRLGSVHAAGDRQRNARLQRTNPIELPSLQEFPGHDVSAGQPLTAGSKGKLPYTGHHEPLGPMDGRQPTLGREIVLS